jgi:hypothetical protein
MDPFSLFISQIAVSPCQTPGNYSVYIVKEAVELIDTLYVFVIINSVDNPRTSSKPQHESVACRRRHPKFYFDDATTIFTVSTSFIFIVIILWC